MPEARTQQHTTYDLIGMTADEASLIRSLLGNTSSSDENAVNTDALYQATKEFPGHIITYTGSGGLWPISNKRG